MSVSAAAVSSALNALRMYGREVARAADDIASAGLVDLATPADDSAPPPPASGGAAPMDLSGAMTSMLLAQRAFAAQLRILRTADEMLKESVEAVKR